ncbi:hypothetical protein TBK1r_02840 [Stieleria magnilauensis]|uniref:Uncharacterized protein n=1 Tax=Stieleria magnilauensis TaxID=2527963 RepID=A0ABX5XN85_9BACT|nr:hypothetical protein TBK1r_02840 [Planctomycetes bacterium TBK1r]
MEKTLTQLVYRHSFAILIVVALLILLLILTGQIIWTDDFVIFNGYFSR